MRFVLKSESHPKLCVTIKKKKKKVFKLIITQILRRANYKMVTIRVRSSYQIDPDPNQATSFEFFNEFNPPSVLPLLPLLACICILECDWFLYLMTQ